MLRASGIILGKDLRLRLRDRSVLLFAFVVPLGLTLLFSFIFPDTEQLSVTAAVVDDDGGEVAAGFVEGVLPALVDIGILELVEVADESAARTAVAAGDLDAVWMIPAGFSDEVVQGRPTGMEVFVSPNAVISAEIARRVAEDYATQVQQVGLAVAVQAAVSGAAPQPEDIQAAATTAAELPPVLSLADVGALEGSRLDSLSYLAAGMAAFFVFFVVQFGVTGLLEERQQGTMPRLLAAPIRPAAVQLGKIAGAFLLGIVSMTVLAVASTLLLGADWGPPGGVAILVVALVLAAIGVMALVGSFARTAEQAGNFQTIVAVVLGMVGGVFFAVPGDAGVLRLASLVSPHGWFMRGLAELTATGDWTAALPAATAIIAFGLVAALPAVVIQRRSQGW